MVSASQKRSGLHPYKVAVVYNHKRHGKFRLGRRTFDFRVKPHFSSKASRNFLLIDLANNLDMLTGNKRHILEQVEAKARCMNPQAMRESVKRYAGARAKKLFGDKLEYR